MRKPMLAQDAPDRDTLARLIASRDLFMAPKIDGFRCLIYGGVAYSRRLKPFPNPWVQEQLSGLPDGTDGELIIGDERAPDVFSRTQAGVMAKSGHPPLRFIAFDNTALPGSWLTRLTAMHDQPAFSATRCARILDHQYVADIDDLTAFEARAIRDGYEGVIIRDGNALYRPGPPPAANAPLLRLKRFATDEARIIGYEEDERWPATAITCAPLNGGEPFRLAQGLERLDKGRNLIGQVISYNHFPHGAQDRPRHATLKGVRPAIDL